MRIEPAAQEPAAQGQSSLLIPFAQQIGNVGPASRLQTLRNHFKFTQVGSRMRILNFRATSQPAIENA